jgi:hypothetical protein
MLQVSTKKKDKKTAPKRTTPVVNLGNHIPGFIGPKVMLQQGTCISRLS